MVVMAMRDKHDVDMRQGLEGDAGIVVPAGAGERERRHPLRPYGVDEDVEPSGLDQPAGMADEGQPRRLAMNLVRRRIGMRARRPFRPAGALAVAVELPAQHFREGFGRGAVGIVEAFTVEMVGDGAGIGPGTAEQGVLAEKLNWRKR